MPSLRVNKLGVSPNKRHRKMIFLFCFAAGWWIGWACWHTGRVSHAVNPFVNCVGIHLARKWKSEFQELSIKLGKANVRVLQVGQSLIVVEKTDVIRYLQPVMKRICSVFRYSEKIAFFFFFYCWWMMLPMSGCLPLSWRQSKTKQNHPPSFYNCLSTGDGHNSVIQWLNSSVDLPCRPTTSIGKRHFI